MSLTTGSHLAQRYRLARRIAVGGMGEVWEAEDTRLGRRVAIKVLKQELTGDPEFRARFHTEARTTASLNHPGIAAVHDYGEATTDTPAGPHGYPAQIAYLVMELVDGDSLATVLTRAPRLGADQTLDILGQAADALQAAHERGLVHRDVKPGNILITPTGRVKLTDFGIAKAVDAAPVTRQGMVMGTAHYIAPEQAAGTEAGPASDIYSLGVVGYECLAGRRPFHSENPLTVAMMHVSDPPPPLPPDVPPAIRTLIDATLVKDPRQRYRDGGEFGSAVASVRAGHGPDSFPAQAPTVAVPTTAMTGQHPTRTALLPPGRADEGPPPGPPGTGHAPRVPAAEPPPKRRSSARTAIVVALLGALVVVLGAYGIREALRAGDGQPPGASSQVPGGEQPAPAPGQQAPEEPAPQAPAPQPDQDDQGSDRGGGQGGDEGTEDGEPTTTEDEPEEVFVVPTDYLGKSGSAAASAAEENNLRPRVVDEDGNEVDSDQQSQCRVSAVDPAAGFVPPGSTLELTCGGSG